MIGTLDTKNTECVICFQKISKRHLIIPTLKCNCSYPLHKKCLIKWITAKGHLQCIYCRENRTIIELREDLSFTYLHFTKCWLCIIFLVFLLVFILTNY